MNPKYSNILGLCNTSFSLICKDNNKYLIIQHLKNMCLKIWQGVEILDKMHSENAILGAIFGVEKAWL